MKTNIKNILALLFFTLISSACADSPLTPKVEEQPPTGHISVLGLMQVTIKGIGTQSMSAVIRPPGSRIAADLTTPSDGSGSHDGSIQYKSVSVGSFTYGDRAADGVRYVYAAFKVRNADASGTIYSTARQNLTFLAVDTDPSAAAGETYEHTAVSELRLYNGDEPANVNNLANNVIPTGWVALNSSGNIESFGADVSQIFTENEVQDFEDTLPTNTEVTDIFPYGFIVRSPNVTPGSRELPSLAGDTRAVEDQFDGVVTFAVKIPLQTVANEDPFEITMLFLAVEDSKTRITRSIEEALFSGNADFEQRVAELGATPTLLGYANYNGKSPAASLVQCGIRVAGTDGSAATTLDTGLGCQNDFFVALNGITVKCPVAGVGQQGIVNGVTYTKRMADQITTSNAAMTCTSGITDMSLMFMNAFGFNADIGSWDVSSVTDMSRMFFDANNFNGDISNWDVSSVTNMSYMFGGGVLIDINANLFNGDISNWDVSSVEDMSGMFRNAYTFNGDISSWDVSSVKDMNTMFANASAFNGDIGSWDVSNVTDMSSMFSYADAFNQNLNSWDVSNVKNMAGMFINANLFNQDLNSWDVSSVTDMNGMFSDASVFNGDIGSWDVSNVTNMSHMFGYADAFNQNLNSWDVSSVTNMIFMFDYAASFNQDLSGWCVSQFNVEPNEFSAGSPLTAANKPVWGTCPVN